MNRRVQLSAFSVHELGDVDLTSASFRHWSPSTLAVKGWLACHSKPNIQMHGQVPMPPAAFARTSMGS